MKAFSFTDTHGGRVIIRSPIMVQITSSSEENWHTLEAMSAGGKVNSFWITSATACRLRERFIKQLCVVSSEIRTLYAEGRQCLVETIVRATGGVN